MPVQFESARASREDTFRFGMACLALMANFMAGATGVASAGGIWLCILFLVAGVVFSCFACGALSISRDPAPSAHGPAAVEEVMSKS